MPCHATKIIFKILPHVISSTDIFLNGQWPHIFFSFFSSTYRLQSICKKHQKFIHEKYLKNQYFALHRNTHKKVAPLKALCCGRSCYHFHAIFCFSALPGMTMCHSYVCALDLSYNEQILGTDIARAHFIHNFRVIQPQLVLEHQCDSFSLLSEYKT